MVISVNVEWWLFTVLCFRWNLGKGNPVSALLGRARLSVCPVGSTSRRTGWARSAG